MGNNPSQMKMPGMPPVNFPNINMPQIKVPQLKCNNSDSLKGGLCVSQCKPGFKNDGLTCSSLGQPILKTFYGPPNFFTRQCDKGTLNAGMCVEPCKLGQKDVGMMCMSPPETYTLPPPYPPKLSTFTNTEPFNNSCGSDNAPFYLLVASIVLLLVCVDFDKIRR